MIHHRDHLYIGGDWLRPRTDSRIAVVSPNTEQEIGSIPEARPQDVDLAVEAARAALPGWSDTAPGERAALLRRVAELLVRDKEEIARVETLDTGKTLKESRIDVDDVTAVFRYYADLADKEAGRIVDVGLAHVVSRVVPVPVGVCALITPWNYPLLQLSWKVAPCLAAGNTCVIKPSEVTPLTSIMLVHLLEEAGVPEGVVNLVLGDGPTVGAPLTEHDDVDMVSFTGGLATGQAIIRASATTVKRVAVELGGKNPLIVFDDADLDKAADALMGSGYGAAGERCMAVSVAVPVGKETADRLVERLIPRVESLKVGPSTDSSADFGPLVTREALERVKGYVDLGVQEGAKLLVDGRNFKMQGYENGFYMGGCLFDEVTPNMRIYKEEIFGPVLSVVRANTYEEALALPNDHEYGNGVAIFTRDGDAARDFAARVNVGMVGINVPIPVPIAYYTFGGWKASAFGDLNQHGPDAFRFYTKTKTVTARWPSGIKDGAEFVIPTMR